MANPKRSDRFDLTEADRKAMVEILGALRMAENLFRRLTCMTSGQMRASTRTSFIEAIIAARQAVIDIAIQAIFEGAGDEADNSS